MESIEVLGLRGSVRAGPLNRALLRAARELARTPFRVEAWGGDAEVQTDRQAVPA